MHIHWTGKFFFFRFVRYEKIVHETENKREIIPSMIQMISAFLFTISEFFIQPNELQIMIKQ